MDSYDHVKYMEAIATNLKEITHSSEHTAFAIASTINIFEGLTEKIGTIYMPAMVVVDDLASRLLDDDSDNLLDVPFYQFIILCKAEINDSESANAARRTAKLLAKKVISRMRRDKRERINGLNNFDSGSVSFDSVGPVGDGSCGCMVTFTLQEPAKIIYSKTDWIDG